MFASLLLTALLAIVPGVSASPTPVPLIYRTVTSEECTTLQNLVLPVGTITKKNNAAFRNMSKSLQKFLTFVAPAPNDVAIESNSQALYGPGAVMSVVTIDGVANEIRANLTLEDKYMTQSWNAYPAGSDPKVDALRKRAQNLIDLQRALADRYQDFTSTYLRNRDNPVIPGVNDPQTLRNVLLGEASALDGNPLYKNAYGLKAVGDLASFGNVDQIVAQFAREERAFAPEVIASFNRCRGTHVILMTPGPAPTPTP